MRDSVDKGTLASSSVMGIQADNHLVGQQCSLLGTILYIGIIIGELPVNRIIPACQGRQASRIPRHLLGMSALRGARWQC